MKLYYLLAIIFFTSPLFSMESNKEIADIFDPKNGIRPITNNFMGQLLIQLNNAEVKETGTIEFLQTTDEFENVSSEEEEEQEENSDTRRAKKKQKTFTCDVIGCKTISYWPTGMRTHRLSHTDPKRTIPCTINNCNGAFKCKEDRDTHMCDAHPDEEYIP